MPCWAFLLFRFFSLFSIDGLDSWIQQDRHRVAMQVQKGNAIVPVSLKDLALGPIKRRRRAASERPALVFGCGRGAGFARVCPALRRSAEPTLNSRLSCGLTADWEGWTLTKFRTGPVASCRCKQRPKWIREERGCQRLCGKGARIAPRR